MLINVQIEGEEKNLHILFIDLEKAYDSVPKEIIWWVLVNKQVSSCYIDAIKDM